jgi:hypothetical protein
MSAQEAIPQPELPAGVPHPEEQGLAAGPPAAETPANPLHQYLDAGDKLEEIRQANGRLPEGDEEVKRLTAERARLGEEIKAGNARAAQEPPAPVVNATEVAAPAVEDAASAEEGEPVVPRAAAAADMAEPELVAAASGVVASGGSEGEHAGSVEPEAPAPPAAGAAPAAEASAVDLGPAPVGEDMSAVVAPAEAKTSRPSAWQWLGTHVLRRGRRPQTRAASPAAVSPEAAQPEAANPNPYGDDLQTLAAFRAAQDTLVDELGKRSKGGRSNDMVAASQTAYAGAFNSLLQGYRAKLEGEHIMAPEEIDAAVTKRKGELVAQYNQRTAPFGDFEVQEDEPPASLRPAA